MNGHITNGDDTSLYYINIQRERGERERQKCPGQTLSHKKVKRKNFLSLEHNSKYKETNRGTVEHEKHEKKKNATKLR